MYSRELNGEELKLAASGWTYNYTFVLTDVTTRSLWYHLEGTDGLTCISGAYADQFLPELPSVLIRWNEWVDQHPNTLYLKGPGG